MEETKQEAVETTETEETEISDTSEIAKLKKLLSQRNSEIANFKKKEKERMSAEERAEAERSEELETLRSKLQKLEHEKSVSDNAAEFVKIGFEVEDAKAAANDLVNGNMQKVFVRLHSFVETLKEKAVSDAMKDTPRPESGVGVKTMTKDEFRKMSVEERYKYSLEHPEEYKEIYGGN